MRGNWFAHEWPFATKTAIIFSTGKETQNNTNIIFESNRVPMWGFRPIWCSSSDSCTIRYNVYTQEFRDHLGERCGNSSCSSDVRDACCLYSSQAMLIDVPIWDVACNRHMNGDFIEESLISPAAVDNETAGCPPYAPP